MVRQCFKVSNVYGSSFSTYFVSRRGISFPTDLLSSPTGLMALLYGRTGSHSRASTLSSPSSSISQQRRVRGRFRSPAPYIRAHPRVRDSPSKPSEELRKTQVSPSSSLHSSKESGDPSNNESEAPKSRRFWKNEAVLLGAVILVLSTIWEWVSGHQDLFSEKIWQLFCYTLEVRSSQQPEYAMIVHWMSLQPEFTQKGKNLALRPVTMSMVTPGPEENSEKEGEVKLIPGYGRHLLRISDGSWLWVHRYEDTNKAKRDVGTSRFGGDLHVLGEHDVLRLTFPFAKRTTVEAFLSAVRQCWESSTRQYVPIYTTNYASSWRLLAHRSLRPLYTLYFPSSIKDIVGEVRTFLSMQKVYRTLGIPWRRGYLLEGAPGTGKTSFVMALAGELGLPVHLLPLHTTELDDESLIRLVSALPPRCILLVEDIESCFSGVDTALHASPGPVNAVESSEPRMAGPASKISMGAFLNAIDGVSSSEGRVLLITTNDMSRIPHPHALLRPGRVDKTIHFAALGEKEMQEMKQHFEEALWGPSGGWSAVRRAKEKATTPDEGANETSQGSSSMGVTTTTFSSSTSPAAYQLMLLDQFYRHMRENNESSPEANKDPLTTTA